MYNSGVGKNMDEVEGYGMPFAEPLPMKINHVRDAVLFTCATFFFSLSPAFLGSAIVEGDLKELDKEVQRCCKSKQTFDRLLLTKEEALKMFDYNAFKR